MSDEAIKGRNAASSAAVEFSLTQGEEAMCLKPPRHGRRKYSIKNEACILMKRIGMIRLVGCRHVYEQEMMMQLRMLVLFTPSFIPASHLPRSPKM